METSTNFLLITANIGSLFEGPILENLQSNWFKEVLKVVKQYQPGFLAIHCQEVGGKKSENNKILVHSFVSDLFNKDELKDYTTCLAYLDEDYKAQNQYTALGSFYFIRNDLKAQQWNFDKSLFAAVEAKKEIYSVIGGNETVQKRKYPIENFPERRWSRKGYMLSRWKIGGRIMDLVNIHLMNDVCNMKALQTSPYTKFRRDTLQYTLDQLNNNELDHCVIFGDFNIRLDTKDFVENHLNVSSPQHIHKDGEKQLDSVVFRSLEDQEKELLRVGSRKFELHNWEYFTMKNMSKLKSLDKELNWCSDQLKEFPITFLPSYPHSEDPKTDAIYSDTRCPAWCDRVLFNEKAYNELEKKTPSVKYDCIAADICIGDHKKLQTAKKLADLYCTSNEIIDLEVKTGSSIRRSEMKSLAAMLEGPIQYIEIPLGCAFFLLDCSNVLNDQHETE